MFRGSDAPPERDEQLHREAMAEMDRLLDKSPEERSELLNTLAQTRPDLHALLSKLLGHADVVNRGFMEPVVVQHTQESLRADARLGPYRIIRLLGEGGMGEVWLASRDDGLYEGQVAIKTLHPYFAGGALRERFLREARVLGRLAHPNIARLLDAGIHDGVVYLVLEYVLGRPLDIACDEGQLDIAARLGIFQKLCAAVAHAHSSLVVHRDIKPGNVLLTAEGAPKLLDFGIASFFETDKAGVPLDITRLTGRIFTPQYAAPEQVLGQEITTATDVYSLGVLLYVLLTGQLPYRVGEDTGSKWEHAVLHEVPLRMSRAVGNADQDARAASRSMSWARLRRELGGDLENIVQKALEKLPQDRYLTVAAFADDVRRYVSGEPVLARPDSTWYRIRKFARRNALAAGAAAAVVVALGVGLAVSLWQLQIAERERRHAEEVKEFVASIFRSADPFFTGKIDMSAAELLALAHQRIDSELQAKPENAVELLNIVGESQVNLEKYDAAKATLTKALEIAERMHPRDEVSIAAARSGLATVAINQGEREIVRPLFDQVLPVLRAHLPATARKYAGSLQMLAFFDSDEQKLDVAIANSREAVDVLVAALGTENSETVLAKRNLALYLVLARRFDEAKPLLEQTLHDAQAMSPSGERLALLAMTESSYARLLVETNEFVAAIEHLDTGIKLATEAFGPGSREVSVLLSLLTRAHARMGDLSAAIATARRAYDASKAGEGQARLATGLGRYTLLARKTQQSLEPLRKAIELEKKYDTGKGSWLTLAQSDYGIALALAGRLTEAKRVLQENLPVAASSAARAALPAAENALGFLEQLQLRWAESEILFRQADAHTSAADRNQKARADTLLGLGVARLEFGNPVEAEQWLRQADEVARGQFVNMIPLRAEIAMQLGRALLGQKKTSAALDSLVTADTYWQDHDASNRGAGEAAYWLAQGHMASGANDRARAALERVAKILADSPLPGDVRLAQGARQALARLPK
ncbi:MAG TPA: protein kinase [Steroidobacteraceae bacterium]|nr:protein kinase [Steroidobacteraceae bacterium]